MNYLTAEEANNSVVFELHQKSHCSWYRRTLISDISDDQIKAVHGTNTIISLNIICLYTTINLLLGITSILIVYRYFISKNPFVIYPQIGHDIFNVMKLAIIFKPIYPIFFF